METDVVTVAASTCSRREGRRRLDALSTAHLERIGGLAERLGALTGR